MNFYVPDYIYQVNGLSLLKAMNLLLIFVKEL